MKKWWWKNRSGFWGILGILWFALGIIVATSDYNFGIADIAVWCMILAMFITLGNREE